MKNRSWTDLGAQGRCRDASGCAWDGFRAPKCRPKADLGAPSARQEWPKAVKKRPQGSPETLRELGGPFPKRPQAPLASPNAVGSVCGSIFQRFRWTRDGSEVRFVSLLPVFYRCRTFCASNACRAQKLRKTVVSGSKIEAQGVLGTLGRASSSAKTAKSSEKARPKCPRGFRKFISGRERGNFERESASSAPEERAGLRSLRAGISESSNG